MTRKARRKKQRELERSNHQPPVRRTAMPWALVGALVASGTIGRGTAQARDLADLLRTSTDRRTAIGANRLCCLQAADIVQVAQAGDGASRPQRFDIPAGPLGPALAALRRATGMTILVPDEAVDAIYSPGVSGLMTVERALEELLAGTSLSLSSPNSPRRKLR